MPHSRKPCSIRWYRHLPPWFNPEANHPRHPVNLQSARTYVSFLFDPHPCFAKAIKTHYYLGACSALNPPSRSILPPFHLLKLVQLQSNRRKLLQTAQKSTRSFCCTSPWAFAKCREEIEIFFAHQASFPHRVLLLHRSLAPCILDSTELCVTCIKTITHTFAQSSFGSDQSCYRLLLTWFLHTPGPFPRVTVWIFGKCTTCLTREI